MTDSDPDSQPDVSESELRDRNGTIAEELEKIFLEETAREVKTDSDDSKYCVSTLVDDTGNTFAVYTLSEYYPTFISYQYSIGLEAGGSLSEAAISELVDDVPAEFPIQVEGNEIEAAGTLALHNMSDAEKDEINYQILDQIDTPHTTYDIDVYEDVIYNVTVIGLVFPAEESHTIQDTATQYTGVMSAAGKLQRFISYTFSGIDNMEIEDIVSEGATF